MHYCSVKYFPLVLITSIFWHVWLSTPVWTKIQPHHCAHNNFFRNDYSHLPLKEAFRVWLKFDYCVYISTDKKCWKNELRCTHDSGVKEAFIEQLEVVTPVMDYLSLKTCSLKERKENAVSAVVRFGFSNSFLNSVVIDILLILGLL